MGSLIVAISVWPGSALPQEEEEPKTGWSWSENFYYSGIVTTEYGYGIDSGDTEKIQSQVVPELNLYLPKDLELTAILRLRAEGEDAIEPGQPSQAERSDFSKRVILGDHAELELREFYVDAYAGSTFFRLGKQQIVWGTADGLKVLDVVNPQDFREFVLEDFDESRIPLWTANVEIPIRNSNLQLVWIPDQTYHDIPEPDATYDLTGRFRPAPRRGAPITVFESPDRPGRVIADSDIGARWSKFWKGWDLSLSYLYHYDDTPVLFRRFESSRFGPIVRIQPEYERTHLFGGTFSNAFGDLTLRGEVGVSLNKYNSTVNVLDRDGVDRTDEFSYVIGLDWFGFTDTLLSFQFFQSILADRASGLVRDKVENTVSFLARRTFLNETLEIENIVVYSLNHGDGFTQPKIAYDLRDNVSLWAGADVFWGDSDELFGQFRETDRVTFGFEWAF